MLPDTRLLAATGIIPADRIQPVLDDARGCAVGILMLIKAQRRRP